jgi:hypothetical protein
MLIINQEGSKNYDNEDVVGKEKEKEILSDLLKSHVQGMSIK